ncbi:hypothetical protein [Caulobacter sp. RL271]|uniref:DNA-directed DNA polymerase n=1 Tax=Caulobacter segnis TaxID=88688 RepID=A0ABY4ZT69_9CAUL|nr:hypothetical protein [Caulobacter segnis]USQ95880.1 hypothetical protein MZV50_25645 [Caulobacter segnis]
MNPTQSTYAKKEPIKIKVDLNIRNPLSKSGVWVRSENFYGEGDGGEAVLIIGFDTEFKPPEEVLTREDIKEGRGNYRVLSYQLHCKIIDPSLSESPEWGTISYPEPGQRLEFGDLLSAALQEAVLTKPDVKIPRKIYLVGHFTRADLPAIADFKQLTPFLTAARNTFITGIPLAVELMLGNQSVGLKMHLRDTMLLTPAASKSLQALGQLVEVPKVKLDDDPVREQFYKANMDALLAEKPDLFDHYAMTDAVICVRYIELLLDQCEEILGRRHVPPTLTSIGVDLLIREWEGRVGDWRALLGMEQVTEKVFDKRTNRPFRKRTIVPFKQVDYHLALANEAYHGGRNEQFWFGPAFEDNWTDYDLSGAYPTAMALIRTPDWRRIYVTDDVTKFTERTLGVADVDFEFPETVRFPTMPVRTENGLIFPRRGTTACGAPEIALALRLGASIKINHGVIVPDVALR